MPVIRNQRAAADVVIIDTAGRLSNNTNLVNQLIKIQSVIQKSINNQQIIINEKIYDLQENESNIYDIIEDQEILLDEIKTSHI